MGEKYLVLNGRKFISSRRASEISGYTLDYIGQLSRSGKLQSKMVGRVRYVDEYSLEQYIANPNGNGVQAPTVLSSEKTTVLRDSEKSPELLKNNKNRISSIRDFDLASKNKVKSRHPFLSLIEGGSLLVALLGLLLVLSTPIGKSGTETFLASLNGFENVALEMEGVDTLTEVKNPVLAAGRTADLYYLGFLHKIDMAILSFLDRTREEILAWLEKGSLYLAHIRSKDSKVVTVETQSSGGPNSVTSTFTDAQIQALVKEMVDKELAARERAGTLGPRTGLFVVPSTGDDGLDDSIKEGVAGSFSDEVIVSVDSDQTSGVIKPVFKNADGKDYLFVLVPIRGANEETTN